MAIGCESEIHWIPGIFLYFSKAFISNLPPNNSRGVSLTAMKNFIVPLEKADAAFGNVGDLRWNNKVMSFQEAPFCCDKNQRGITRKVCPQFGLRSETTLGFARAVVRRDSGYTGAIEPRSTCFFTSHTALYPDLKPAR